MNKQLKQGFTLVEIMIVVAIIGILAAIAVPNFVKSRQVSQKNACIANLKQIQAAKEQVLINGETLDADSVSGYLKVHFSKMTCPADANTKPGYNLGDADTDPTCKHDTANHVIPSGS